MSLFRRGPTRDEAEASLASVRSVIEILRLSRANLAASDALLREADAELARGSTQGAVDLAERAERVATQLEEEYRRALDARATLQSDVDRMRELGIPDEEEQTAFGAVHARAIGTRQFEGVEVPDYAAALSLAEEAAARAEAKIALCESAGDVVFAAELAIDAATDADHGANVEVLQEARALLAKARLEAGNGAYELAATDAAVAEKIALALVDQRRQALETLESVQKLVTGLKAAGVAVSPVAKALEIGRTLLDKGRLSAAIDVLNEAAQEAVGLGTQYRQVLEELSRAAAALDTLKGEGLESLEAESAFARAKASAKQGNYALALACVEDVHLALAKQRDFRDGLRVQIAAVKAQIDMLRDSGRAFVNDVEEMVAKAEKAFDNGDYQGTSDDLRIASLLMAGAPNGRGERAPEPP